jgi:hypothetical protein
LAEKLRERIEEMERQAAKILAMAELLEREGFRLIRSGNRLIAHFPSMIFQFI